MFFDVFEKKIVFFWVLKLILIKEEGFFVIGIMIFFWVERVKGMLRIVIFDEKIRNCLIVGGKLYSIVSIVGFLFCLNFIYKVYLIILK